jgi:putative membrane protein
MVKALLRNTGIYALSLYLLPSFVGGVEIVGGLFTLIIAGIALSLLFVFVKPIFSVLTFPFNVITMGLFSLITNALILYLLTVFVPNVTIAAYKFSGLSVAGFSIHAVQLNTIVAFILSALVISLISGTIRWLIK